jgi:hypothetical protein
VQRRNISTSLAKRIGSRFPAQAVSAFFFRPEPPLDYRSWLNQTGISLASGALESWWIRLELNPVAPAILRIEQLAQKKEKAVTYQTGPRQVFRGGGSVR